MIPVVTKSGADTVLTKSSGKIVVIKGGEGIGYDGVMYVYQMVETGRTEFFDNFNSYTEGQLSGQGIWSGAGNTQVTGDGTIKSGGGGGYNTVEFIDLDESKGWEFSCKVIEASVSTYMNLYFGEFGDFEIYDDESWFYWSSIDGNYGIGNYTPFEADDIVTIKIVGRHIEFFRNGVIDTGWFADDWHIIGEEGVFDSLEDYNWGNFHGLKILISDAVLEIDDIRFDYNITQEGQWVPRPLLVADPFLRRPVYYYTSGAWHLTQSF